MKGRSPREDRVWEVRPPECAVSSKVSPRVHFALADWHLWHADIFVVEHIFVIEHIFSCCGPTHTPRAYYVTQELVAITRVQAPVCTLRCDSRSAPCVEPSTAPACVVSLRSDIFVEHVFGYANHSEDESWPLPVFSRSRCGLPPIAPLCFHAEGSPARRRVHLPKSTDVCSWDGYGTLCPTKGLRTTYFEIRRHAEQSTYSTLASSRLQNRPAHSGADEPMESGHEDSVELGDSLT